jgi:hypothetical protein
VDKILLGFESLTGIKAGVNGFNSALNVVKSII